MRLTDFFQVLFNLSSSQWLLARENRRLWPWSCHDTYLRCLWCLALYDTYLGCFLSSACCDLLFCYLCFRYSCFEPINLFLLLFNNLSLFLDFLFEVLLPCFGFIFKRAIWQACIRKLAVFPHLLFKVRIERQTMPLPKLACLFIERHEVQLEACCGFEYDKTFSCWALLISIRY